MLSYTVSGSGDAVAVLLHELGGSQRSWDAVASQVEHEFQVLRYDQRGQGDSEKVRAPFTLDDHVGDLEGLMRASGLAPPYLLVGAAAGCAVAIAYAARWPDRVAALLLCAPALGADASRKTYLAERSQKAVSEGMRAVVDGALANSYPPALRGDGKQFDAYRAQLLTCDPVGYAHANQALADADLATDLGLVKCPCVLLAGRHDPLRPLAYVRKTADALAHARVMEIDSGHLMPTQAPAVIAAQMLALKKNVHAG
jgi:3-oxoadipate enol-lactonase